ncbi:unnamed protein product [Dibothriocephalus latus]|uniref:Tektin n=1 Tax=Dibothriocephalus latus TaxID=60516 RepID=A0A3P7LYC1_DIBLA|nr:unnamed protein product [Dibothriocephalus latus]
MKHTAAEPTQIGLAVLFLCGSSMLDELTDIQNSIDRLRDKLNLSENNLKHLQDTQLMLEKEIHMKNNSIQVDKDHCVRHRMAFPDAVRLEGH